MARVTVEDCLSNVDNRFELTLVAARRARQLSLGAAPLVDPDRDKPTVIALREVAAGAVGKDILDQPAPPPLANFPGAGTRSGGKVEDEPGS